MSLEYLVQVAPILGLAALMTAWLAQLIWRARGYGLVNDMILSLAGSLVLGPAFRILIPSQVGMVAMVLIGTGAGALAIIAQRAFWRPVRAER